MHKISVIIATKDRRNYIIDLLSDINSQNCEVHEVIVSDQSEEFIPIEKDYSFKLIHFKHLGVGPCCSRNDAVDRTSGDILVFLDDDARIDKDFINEIAAPILKNDYRVVSGSVIHVNVNEDKNKRKDDDHWFMKMTGTPNKNFDNKLWFTPAGCTAILKNTFNEVGKFDEFFDPNGAGEDRELGVRLVKNNIEIFHNPKARLIHLGADSGGRRNNKNTSLEFNKNIGYIIYKYYGKRKFVEYRIFLINQRVKKIIRLNMPLYNFKMLHREFLMINSKFYKK